MYYKTITYDRSGAEETGSMIKEVVTVVLVGLALPAAAQAQSGQGDDAMVCRPPQQLPGQRMYGPKVCKPRRVWDDLHRQGLDISADGQSVGESEKFRTFHCPSGAVTC